MPSVIEDIGGSVVHTAERFRVVVQSYTHATAVTAVTGIAVTGVGVGDTVLSVGPARAADVVTGRAIQSITRGSDGTVGWTPVGVLGATATVNLAFLVFSPSKVVL